MAAGNYMFGAGTLTVGGVAIGTQQGGSIDIDADTVELFGAYEFPVDVASGKKKVTGKFSHGEIQAEAIDKLLGSTSGVVDNKLMGAAAPFAISWTGTYRGKTGTFSLAACVFKKLTVKWGNATHVITDAEFAAFDDGTGHVLTFTMAAASGG